MGEDGLAAIFGGLSHPKSHISIRHPVVRSRISLVGILLFAALPVSAQSTVSDSAVRTSAVEHRLPGRYSADGRREILALRASVPIKLDGVLDDDAWQRAEPAAAFVQAEPLEGRAATEATEVRIIFDSDHLYIGAVLRDSDPAQLVVNDIRKDFAEEDQDDFEVLLDTFGDRRNAYVFITNVEGARHDRQVALEGRELNLSWDAVWDVRTARRADGWVVEMRIPFRALRFDRESDRPWGINFSRHIRRKNEVDFWSPVPRSYNLNRVSLAGNLAGVQTGSAGRDLRIKPYVVGNSVRPLGTLQVPDPRFRNDVDAGVDVKAAVTSGLTADLTVNPDFAQAEADEQQVNLTQLSQFFPEKRDFFLENSGVFYVGDAARNNRVFLVPTPDEDNLLFFSRRIGLTAAGIPVPIDGGVRLTGKVSEHTRIGVLTIQERALDSLPAVNSSVVRVRQNVGSTGNDVGAIFMQRQVTSGGGFHNRVYGMDSNFRLFGNLDWNSYYVQSETPGVTTGQHAWRSTLNWEGNFYHGKGGVMELGEGFRNDLGYYRRTATRKWLLDTGIRPRSTWLRAHGIRELHPHVRWDYYQDLHGVVNGKTFHNGFSFFFNNGAVFELAHNPNFQRLEAPLRLTPTQHDPIPPGGYGWTNWSILFQSDLSAPLSTTVRASRGGLWTGEATSVSGSVTVRPSYRFYVVVGIQRTDARLDLPDERVVTSLYTLRGNYSFSTNMFVDALSQYDPASHQLSANVRFNLIHHPLSDLFVVYNDQRFLTTDSRLPGRGLSLKFTQMFSM